MDKSRVPQLDGFKGAVKKRRSQTPRRPKSTAQSVTDRSAMTSIDENSGDTNPGAEMFDLKKCVPGGLPAGGSNTGDASPRAKMFDLNPCEINPRAEMFNLNQFVFKALQVGGSESGSSFVTSKGVSDGAGNEEKLKEVKLKLGGGTGTIQTKCSSDGALDSVKTNREESYDEYHSPPINRKGGLQGIPWKDFSKGDFCIGRDDMGRGGSKNALEKKGEKSNSVRRSKRVPKKRVLDDEFYEDEDEDDEIRYLKKLGTFKMMGHKEEEPLSDGEPEGQKKKTQEKDLSDLPSENNREMALTTRQRALLNKDSSSSVASQVEFPDGLPPAPSRKQKAKMSEVELQLKKAEAAERRRMQNEKAARELEAEAIRKILGQDSGRKKREEKMKKRQEELAQEKATSAEMLATNVIRTVIGPTGTTVTFPQEMGLPKIFDSKPISYPPPREKCAGPNCTNPYRYRHSKLKLPLCSLECYKAVEAKMQTEK